MKTPFWETLEIFDPPISGKNIGFVELQLKTPEGVEEIIRGDWEKQLISKQKELEKLGRPTKLKPYHLDSSKNPLPALYEGEKAIMWPGQVITLTGLEKIKDKISLKVAQTSFPFINGLKNPEITRIYETQGITKPRPSLAISTFAITSDNYLVLTVRGPATNMYPGRMYGQGGNPQSPLENVVQHQIDEMKDEILVTENDFNPNNFAFAGIVVDKDQLPDKPDLVGWIPIKLDSESLQKKFYSRPVKDRPSDARGIVFIKSDKEILFETLTKGGYPLQFNPPTHAALMLYGQAVFGKSWSKRVLSKTNNWEKY